MKKNYHLYDIHINISN